MAGRILLMQPKVTVSSGSAGDFPSSTTFYDTADLESITVLCAPAAATARTIQFTFADSAGNTLFSISKALAATTVVKNISIGDVSPANSIQGTDSWQEFMTLPPKVRVTLQSAAVNIDVAIVGRGITR